MSRVLIVQSPYHFRDPCAHLSEPLGVEYLCAGLRAAGHEVAFHDPTIAPPTPLPDGMYYYGAPDAEIARRIRAYAPDVVGISCHYAFGSADAYNVARIARETAPSAATVMGGLFVSTHGAKPLEECPALDYCVVGEADRTFPDLVERIAGRNAGGLAPVDGLIRRENGVIRVDPKSRYIDDLDALPFPARDLVDLPTYMGGSRIKRLYGLGFRPALSILTSRSCPHRCSFCNMRLVHGTRWRPRSAENVLDEIGEILGRYGAEHVFIMDDNFGFKTERAKAICEMIVRRGHRFRWNTPNGISVKGIDRELAVLMKKAGCANVCVAIESGSEYIRTTVMNKKTSDADIVNAVACFRAAGIPVVGFVLLGMPGENAHHFGATIDLLKRLPLTSVVVSFAIPFPGTRLHEQLVGDGTIGKDEIVGMDDLNVPSFETPDFTREELVRRKARIKEMFPSLAELYELETAESGGNGG